MAETVQTFKGENSNIIQKIQEITEKQKQAAAVSRETARATKEGYQGMVTGAESAAKSIGEKLIPGLSQMGTTAGATSLAITKAFELVSASIKQATDAANKFQTKQEELINLAANAGKLTFLPELQQRAKELRSATAPAGAVESVLGQVIKTGGTGTQMTKALEFGVKALEGGMSGPRAAENYGSLAKAFPNAPAADLQRAAGRLAGMEMDESKLLMLKSKAAAGATLDEAAASVFGLWKSSVGGKVAGAFEGLTAGDPESLSKPGAGVLSPEQQARVKDLRAQHLALQAKKDSIGAERDAAPHAGKGRRGEWEAQQHELDRQMRALMQEASTIELNRAEDPSSAAKRMRKLELAELPRDVALAKAEETGLDLLSPQQQFHARAYLDAKRAYGQAPDLVAKSKTELETYRSSSETQRREAELNRQKALTENRKDDIGENPVALNMAAKAEETSRWFGGGEIGKWAGTARNVLMGPEMTLDQQKAALQEAGAHGGSGAPGEAGPAGSSRDLPTQGFPRRILSGGKVTEIATREDQINYLHGVMQKLEAFADQAFKDAPESLSGPSGRRGPVSVRISHDDTRVGNVVNTEGTRGATNEW